MTAICRIKRLHKLVCHARAGRIKKEGRKLTQVHRLKRLCQRLKGHCIFQSSRIPRSATSVAKMREGFIDLYHSRLTLPLGRHLKRRYCRARDRFGSTVKIRALGGRSSFDYRRSRAGTGVGVASRSVARRSDGSVFRSR